MPPPPAGHGGAAGGAAGGEKNGICGFTTTEVGLIKVSQPRRKRVQIKHNQMVTPHPQYEYNPSRVTAKLQTMLQVHKIFSNYPDTCRSLYHPSE